MNKNQKQQKRVRRHRRIRSKISGTSERPRLSIFKSNTLVYAQVIDDEKAVTLVSAKGADAEKVGAEIAKKALAKKIAEVVFDRGGFLYTGKVTKIAEGARKGGLKF